MNRLLLLFVALFMTTAIHAREPQRGYRGFIDWENTIGVLDYSHISYGYFDQEKLAEVYGHRTRWLSGVSTSHGYQFNSHIYTGIGIMFSHAISAGDIMLPVFAHFRYDYTKGKFRPFVELRGGYNFREGGGVYFSPAVGYRLNWGRKSNLNFGIGMTVISRPIAQFVYLYDHIDYPEYSPVLNIVIVDSSHRRLCHYPDKRRANALFTLRIGIDF